MALLAPNLTAVADVKPAPVMTTDVPLVSGPALGLTPLTTGTNENLSPATTVLVPRGVVTVTSTTPVPAGEVAVMEVLEFTV